MTSIATLHRRACQAFAGHVARIRSDQWRDPTPCTEWTVRDLVNHVTAEDLWTAPLMRGATLEEVGDRFDGDVLGDDPVAANEAATSRATEAVSEPGALQRTVHLSYGDEAAEEYVWQLFADHLVHGWDLARAIGSDDRIDDGLVDACAAWFAPHEDTYRAAGLIGPRGAVDETDDPQARLLLAFGRSPDWPAGTAVGPAVGFRPDAGEHGS